MGKRIQVAPLPRVAAIYCRVSTESQATDAKTSPDTQIRACRQWCAENGWSVDESQIYQDAHSGEEWFERPQLRALLDAAKHRAFGMVVALSVDRLTRNASHMVILLDELERAGVAVDFVTEKLDDTPEGRLMLNVRAYAAVNACYAICVRVWNVESQILATARHTGISGQTSATSQGDS